MQRRLLVGVAVLAVIGCDRGGGSAGDAGGATASTGAPNAERVESAARNHAGPEATFRLWVGDDDGLEVLEAMGLVRHTPGAMGFDTKPRKLELTARGSELGLVVQHPPKGFEWVGPDGVHGDALCKHGFAEVVSSATRTDGPMPAATVVYTTHSTAQSALYRALEGKLSGNRSLSACAPTESRSHELVLVLRGELWAINRPPMVRAESTRSELSYDYDPRGLTIGATTKLELVGLEVQDPDGDPLTVVGWSGEYYSPRDGMRSLDREIERDGVKVKLLTGDGSNATLRHFIYMGQPSGARLRYLVKDPWAEGAFEVCVEGHAFGC